jgi:DNA-binding MarR family transcriptional regulator
MAQFRALPCLKVVIGGLGTRQVVSMNVKVPRVASKSSKEVLDHSDQDKLFTPPLTISHRQILTKGRDDEFRQTIYLIVQVLSRLEVCRAAFGRALGLTGSQFAVLIGVAYQQGETGVKINSLSKYVQLASTHVTTEVGVLSRRGLLIKHVGVEDRRSVLVKLSPEGEAAVERVAPFLRRVNDQLFNEISREQITRLREIFTTLSFNSEFALAEVRRYEREREGS